MRTSQVTVQCGVLLGTACGLLLCATPAALAETAEIHLRAAAATQGGIIRLGHVAEIRDAAASTRANLERIALLPAPTTGRTQTISARQVRETLHLYNVDSAKYRLTGARSVQVRAGTAVRGPRQAQLTETRLRMLRQNVQRVVLEYLRDYVSAEAEWQVQVDPATLAGLPVLRPEQMEVHGGKPPWTGTQRFQLVSRDGRTTQHTDITATIGLPRPVVVARHTIRAGNRITTADVELRATSTRRTSGQPLHSLEQVLGQQATRSISAGQVLDDRAVRAPILVKRRQRVTVISRAAGIVVATTGITLEQGAAGDLVEVELDGQQTAEQRRRIVKKDKVIAQVRDARVVEVFANGPAVAARPARPVPRQQIFPQRRETPAFRFTGNPQ